MMVMNKSSVFVLLVIGCLAIVPTPVLMQTGGKNDYSVECRQLNYNIREGETARICLKFQDGSQQVDRGFNVTLNIISKNQTAGESDYVPINLTLTVAFTIESRGMIDLPCVNVSTISDSVTEGMETLLLVINQTEPVQSSQTCTIAIVDIEDDTTLPSDSDSPVIGGSQPTPDVSDSAPVGVIVGVVLGVVIGIIALIVAIVTAIVVGVVVCRRRKIIDKTEKYPRSVVYKRNGDVESSMSNVSEEMEVNDAALDNPIYSKKQPGEHTDLTDQGNTQSHSHWWKLFSRVTISHTHLQFGDCLGEGAFGKVFQASLSSPGTGTREVAIKTLKDKQQPSEVEDFLTESAIMLEFRHPNVLNLIGVCFDSEDQVPVIVLPLMTNGDLRMFLLEKRKQLKPKKAYPEGLSKSVLIKMCLDVALGMDYLSKKKFVHRDLAARNCMVDGSLNVKVADFGRSRDVYSSDYYRLTHEQRLPVKWMALESLFECTYTEKTDVWSYGVLCWEVFKLGKKPYSELDNRDIPDFLSAGNRLDKPSRCPQEMFTFLLRTWELDSDKRPSFSDIATMLTSLTGHSKTQQSDGVSVHSSKAVNGTSADTPPFQDNGTSEDTPPFQDNGTSADTPSCSNITSPVYSNFPPREQMVGANFLSALVPQSIPEEYEVPLSLSTRNSSVEEDSVPDQPLYEVPSVEEDNVPDQPLYEVPLSTSNNSNGSIEEADVSQQPLYEIPLSTRSNSNESATEEERGHIYHTLEPHEA